MRKRTEESSGKAKKMEKSLIFIANFGIETVLLREKQISISQMQEVFITKRYVSNS